MPTVDPHLHLFADDREILELRTVCRVSGRPYKHPEPVIAPDQPWERGQNVQLWGSVMWVPEVGRLRMWYLIAGGGGPHAQAVAESEDGIHWTKPNLGLVEWNGSRENNLCLRASEDGPITNFDGMCVVRDEHDPDPQARYKALSAIWPESGKFGGLYLLTSSDGLRWNMPPLKVIEGVGDRNRLVYDTLGQRWLAQVGKSWVHDGYAVRTVMLCESRNLLDWSPPVAPIALDEQDGHGALQQFHFMLPFCYGSQYLGFLDTIKTVEGVVEPYLVTSRDGREWERPGRTEPFLTRGAEGAWDELGINLAHSPPIVMGDHMFMCYTGRARPHDRMIGAIGLATLRRDRFIGLRSQSLFGLRNTEGVATTRPVRVTGPRLYLNMVTYWGYAHDGPQDGTVQVELLDETLKPIAGFSRAEAEYLKGDDIRCPVRWKGKEDLRELAGRSVTLRLWINRGTIYAYTFAP